MLRKMQSKDSTRLSMTVGRGLEEGSEGNQAESFLDRLDEVEGSMHKMLALLEHCLD